MQDKSQVKFKFISTGRVLPQNTDPSTIYIIEDTRKMYVGSLEIGKLDADLSKISTNGVQNNIITAALEQKAEFFSGYSHNSFYRGKDLGTAVTQDQWDTIGSGDFDDIFIGDYWTIDGRKYVVAKVQYCSPVSRRGNTVVSRNIPSVIMMDFSESYRNMNSTDTTDGGYANSDLCNWLDSVIGPQLDAAFGSNHVYPMAVTVDNAVTNGIVTGATNINVKSLLLSELNVWGYRRSSFASHTTELFDPSYPNVTFDPISGGSIPYIELCGSRGPHGGIGWLRDVVDSTRFAYVHSFQNYGGYSWGREARSTSYVRPVFTIYHSI